MIHAWKYMCLTEHEAQHDSVVYSMRFCSELFISEPPLLILFRIILSIFCVFFLYFLY